MLKCITSKSSNVRACYEIIVFEYSWKIPIASGKRSIRLVYLEFVIGHSAMKSSVLQ